MRKQHFIDAIQHQFHDSELNEIGIKIKQAALKILYEIPDERFDRHLEGNNITIDPSHDISQLLLELFHNKSTNLFENVELIPFKQINYLLKYDIILNNIKRYNIYDKDDNCIGINYDLVSDDKKEFLIKILNKNNVFACNLPIVRYNDRYYNIPDNGINLNIIYGYLLNNQIKDNIIILYRPTNQNFDEFRMICINNNTGDLIAINN